MRDFLHYLTFRLGTSSAAKVMSLMILGALAYTGYGYSYIGFADHLSMLLIGNRGIIWKIALKFYRKAMKFEEIGAMCNLSEAYLDRSDSARHLFWLNAYKRRIRDCEIRY